MAKSSTGCEYTHQRRRRQEFQRAQEVARIAARRGTRRLPCLRADWLCCQAARMLLRPCCGAAAAGGTGGNSCGGQVLTVLEAATGQLHAAAGKPGCKSRRLQQMCKKI